MTINKPPCILPEKPKPPEVGVYEQGCPEGMVCIDIQSAIDIGTWVKAMLRLEKALDACPQVQFGGDTL